MTTGSRYIHIMTISTWVAMLTILLPLRAEENDVDKHRRICKARKKKIENLVGDFNGDSVMVIYSSPHEEELLYYTNRPELLENVREKINEGELVDLFAQERYDQGNLLTLPSKPLDEMGVRDLKPLASTITKEFATLAEYPQSLPGYQHPERKPSWWPQSVTWQASALQKTGKDGLIAVIRACYEYFGVRSELTHPPEVTNDTSTQLPEDNATPSLVHTASQTVDITAEPESESPVNQSFNMCDTEESDYPLSPEGETCNLMPVFADRSNIMEASNTMDTSTNNDHSSLTEMRPAIPVESHEVYQEELPGTSGDFGINTPNRIQPTIGTPLAEVFAPPSTYLQTQIVQTRSRARKLQFTLGRNEF